jgi:hypothetical protein
MTDSRVDPLIASRLRLESESSVSLAVLNALRLREPSDALASALDTVAREGSDPHARHRAVEVIGLWLRRRPDLRSTLRHVAEKDERTAIRDAARAALDRG